MGMKIRSSADSRTPTASMCASTVKTDSLSILGQGIGQCDSLGITSTYEAEKAKYIRSGFDALRCPATD